ncbi:gluconate 2-dehydrogenase subunit 3 family protein [Amnibacterium endophyticum]|uniref:Gluconate 2-dehydrogenase subunit 3 family protein n=1 Tax=Amnibacterium endophyticum TaxID=2109337 RepID=A0ABW4LG53_9MICO
MSAEADRGDAWKRRFPGFSAVGQAQHWDEATRKVVLGRLEPPKPIRYLPEELRPAGIALVAQLIDVDQAFAFGLLSSIDARLADNETDGWHYDDMPIDHDAWKRSLAGLDADAEASGGTPFAALPHDAQHDLLEGVRTSQADLWHGMPPARVWNLWTRYVCTAFYAHPSAWDEMGFPGPAYPRGYKNPGLDAREPFEVKDTMPHMDPTVSSAP